MLKLIATFKWNRKYINTIYNHMHFFPSVDTIVVMAIILIVFGFVLNFSINQTLIHSVYWSFPCNFDTCRLCSLPGVKLLFSFTAVQSVSFCRIKYHLNI